MSSDTESKGYEACLALVGDLARKAAKNPGSPEARRLLLVGATAVERVAPIIFNEEVGFTDAEGNPDPSVVPRALGYIKQVVDATRQWARGEGGTEPLVELRGEANEDFWEVIGNRSDAEESAGKMVDNLLEAALNLDTEWIKAQVPREERREVAELGAFNVEEIFAEHLPGALNYSEGEIDWENMHRLLEETISSI